MGRVDGKVAVVTGAARGQGRAHAVRLAAEGADIVAIDICAQIPSVSYQMATSADLEATGEEVEALRRRVVTAQADVRDLAALEDTVRAAVQQLGRIDIVVANAGIAPLAVNEADPVQVFRDVIDVNLAGAWNTVRATSGALIDGGRGGSVILISSVAGLKGFGVAMMAAAEAYTASKHGVVGLMRVFAREFAEYSVRVNTIHPTGVKTPMVENETLAEVFAKYPELMESQAIALPVANQMLDPSDISDAVLWLASDESRYVTGTTLPVDAGSLVL
jgi:SDR family mycofactocin-dependent oxidoreductase